MGLCHHFFCHASEGRLIRHCRADIFIFPGKQFFGKGDFLLPDNPILTKQTHKHGPFALVFLDRQSDDERGPLAFFAGDIQPPAVFADNVVGDAQS